MMKKSIVFARPPLLFEIERKRVLHDFAVTYQTFTLPLIILAAQLD